MILLGSISIIVIAIVVDVYKRQIIAQELTYYGVDLYKRQKLPELIERIANVPGVEWIRLHYAYPVSYTHLKTNELCISSTMPYILISFSKTKPIFAT